MNSNDEFSSNEKERHLHSLISNNIIKRHADTEKHTMKRSKKVHKECIYLLDKFSFFVRSRRKRKKSIFDCWSHRCCCCQWSTCCCSCWCTNACRTGCRYCWTWCWLFEISSRLILQLIRHWMDFETIKSCNKLICWTFWSIFWMNHKKHMWKTCTEISTIDMMMSWTSRMINIHAFRTIEFNHRFTYNFRKADLKSDGKISMKIKIKYFLRVTSVDFHNRFEDNSQIQHFDIFPTSAQCHCSSECIEHE